MDEIEASARLVVCADQRGIVVSALVTRPGEVESGMEPLDGQTLHDFDVPEDLAHLQDSRAVLKLVANARIDKGELILPSLGPSAAD